MRNIAEARARLAAWTATVPAGTQVTIDQAMGVSQRGANYTGPMLRELGWTRKYATDGARVWFTPLPDAAQATIDEAAEVTIAGLSAEDELQARVSELEAQLKAARRVSVDAKYVKTTLFRIADLTPTPPDWLAVAPAGQKSTSPGVPTLLASDWHWGEVVAPEQVAGVNQYNLEIAQARARHLINTTVELLQSHMVNPDYPGIVFALGGDMVSGDIHEELTATNETEIMPVLLDLFSVLVWCIDTLRKHFKRVFIPAVSGNHARTTQKIRSKGRNHTSFDWLVYNLLARHFDKDPNVIFLIPDGPDCLYSVLGHRYLLTHGDQFRGGDGMIGALGPIIRGDHKKRSRNTQVGHGYDTMLLGHWHQLIQLQRLIVNGSLVGYNEYAYNGNFGFEPPRQALWITHPTQGITFSMPVNAEKPAAKPESHWVEWRV